MKIFEIICMFFFLSSCTNTTFIQEDSKTINIDVAKVAIIGEIWKSRAKLLRNRLFKKIASATE